MNRSVEIVVLSHFAEIVSGFCDSVENVLGKSGGIVVFDQQALIEDMPRRSKWVSIGVDEPFQMARNATIGFKMTRDDQDVLYCGDDIRFQSIDTIEALQGLAYSDDALGILSPKIIGHAQENQMRPTVTPLTYVNWVSFPCVYIKRDVFRAIGYFDERFEGYGVEDIDFCVRARQAGFKIAVAHDVAVAHGIGGMTYGSTFRKIKTEKQMADEDRANWSRFAEKFGLRDDHQAIFEFIERGVPNAAADYASR